MLAWGTVAAASAFLPRLASSRAGAPRFGYAINETGAFILARAERGQDEEDIAAELAENYNLESEEALRDVARFMKQLRKAGMLR